MEKYNGRLKKVIGDCSRLLTIKKSLKFLDIKNYRKLWNLEKVVVGWRILEKLNNVLGREKVIDEDFWKYWIKMQKTEEGY